MATISAAQVNTTAGSIVAENVGGGRRTVFVANLGPNAIYLGMSNAVTTATGYPVAATSGTATVVLEPGDRLFAIAATALQVSPADTRISVQ